MERIVAVKKLAKMLGKGFGYQINSKAPDREEREAAKIEHATALAEATRLRDLRDARYKAVLQGDKEYQDLFAAHKAAREVSDKLRGKTYSYKIMVGNSMDIGGFRMFSVKAEGDSWEEVIAKLKK